MSSQDTFRPFIPSSKKVREFTPRALILGLIFGFFFAVANAYLALKMGTTISASIPAAIMSMAILRLLFKNSTVLENNIVQTIATVGEGLAAGVVFTIPALILLGDSPSITRIFLLSSLGGILGILFMIPMRRFIIVEEHKRLPFPEGTACAELIKAGEKSHHTAIFGLWGLLLAAVYKIFSNAIFLWKEVVSWSFPSLKKGTFSMDATPALLGVGYIIGPYISGLLFAGSVIAYWVIIPLIVQFGMGTEPIYPATVAISQMSADDIWDNYVRYIGAGCLATGGIYSLFHVLPLLYKAIRVSTKELFSSLVSRSHLLRTDRDISMAWLILGSLAIILFLWLAPIFNMNFLTIVLLVVLGFFFVAVTSLAAGLVGSSSNPVSGMTITTLLITCIIFVLLGWTERVYLLSAMMMGCVSCTAICMAGTTSQDLKTGYILGSTPMYQQVAEIIGVIIPSLALGYVIYALNQAYGIGSSVMPAPQATLMALVVKGVISGNLPYGLVGLGVFIGIAMIILRVPVLPFALGVYLPLSLTTATMVGGLVRAYVNFKSKSSEQASERGILLASGLIGGDACIGILLVFATLAHIIPADRPGILPDWTALIAFFFLALLLGAFSLRKKGQPSS